MVKFCPKCNYSNKYVDFNQCLNCNFHSVETMQINSCGFSHTNQSKQKIGRGM